MKLRLPKICWLYVLFSPQFRWLGKVGISTTPNIRLSDIERSMQQEFGRHVRVYCIMKLPMLWAKKFEMAIHRSKLWVPSGRVKGTSGWTEWGWCLNLFSCIIAGSFAYCKGHSCPHYVAAIVAIIPLPLDFCLYIFLFFVVQVACLIVVGWTVIHFAL